MLAVGIIRCLASFEQTGSHFFSSDSVITNTNCSLSCRSGGFLHPKKTNYDVPVGIDSVSLPPPNILFSFQESIRARHITLFLFPRRSSITILIYLRFLDVYDNHSSFFMWRSAEPLLARSEAPGSSVYDKQPLSFHSSQGCNASELGRACRQDGREKTLDEDLFLVGAHHLSHRLVYWRRGGGHVSVFGRG